MSTMITIRDESTGLGHEDRVFTIEMPSESMTVRELIRERVYQEVDDYNLAARQQAESPRYYGLVEPEACEQKLNASPSGRPTKRPRQLDWKKQLQVAIDAYEHNRFLVLVGDEQTTSLEQTIELTPSTEVVFLKLVMLVGG